MDKKDLIKQDWDLSKVPDHELLSMSVFLLNELHKKGRAYQFDPSYLNSVIKHFNKNPSLCEGVRQKCENVIILNLLTRWQKESDKFLVGIELPPDASLTDSLMIWYRQKLKQQKAVEQLEKCLKLKSHRKPKIKKEQSK